MNTMRILIAILLSSSCVFAGHVVLVKGPGITVGQFEALQTHAAKNLPLPVKSGEALCTSNTYSFAATPKTNVLAVLVVLDSQFTSCTNTTIPVAKIFNLRSIRDKGAARGATGSDALERQYERSLMQTLGMALGLKEGCLNPRCAMCSYDELTHLKLGRNFCPACISALEERFRSQLQSKRR